MFPPSAFDRALPDHYRSLKISVCLILSMNEKMRLSCCHVLLSGQHSRVFCIAFWDWSHVRYQGSVADVSLWLGPDGSYLGLSENNLVLHTTSWRCFLALREQRVHHGVPAYGEDLFRCLPASVPSFNPHT